MIRTTHNPLNIRYARHNQWLGQCGEYRGFCVFLNDAYGFRAAFINLCSYLKQGHDTIEEIINRWAPPHENKTEAYINFVTEDCLIDRNYHLHMTSIHGYWEIIMVLRAMAKMECGRWYDEQLINLYINYPEKY